MEVDLNEIDERDGGHWLTHNSKTVAAPDEGDEDEEVDVDRTLRDSFNAAFGRVLYKKPFEESKHPRAGDGKFSDKAGGGSSAAPKKSPTPKASTRKAPTTPAFHNWFGDSKVVDSTGNPLIVYHGTHTPERFIEFDPSKHRAPSTDIPSLLGHGFTDSTDVADRFTHEVLEEKSEGGRIKPMYLSIKKPLIIEDDNADNYVTDDEGNKRRKVGADPRQEPLDKLRAMILAIKADARPRQTGITKPDEQDSWLELNHGDAKKFRDQLEAQGYDGIIIKDTTQSSPAEYHDQPRRVSTMYIAFDSTQIKSSIGNSGAYDPKDRRTTYARAFNEAFKQRYAMFEESKHPRDEIGEFTTKGGGGGGGKREWGKPGGKVSQQWHDGGVDMPPKKLAEILRKHGIDSESVDSNGTYTLAKLFDGETREGARSKLESAGWEYAGSTPGISGQIDGYTKGTVRASVHSANGVAKAVKLSRFHGNSGPSTANKFVAAPEQQSVKTQHGEITRSEAANLLDAIRANGGVTYQPVDDTTPSEGYVVATRPEAESFIPVDKVTPGDIFDYMVKHADLFDQRGEPRYHFGGWIQDGNVCFDTPHVEKNLEAATALGIKYNQYAIFDLVNGVEIHVESERTKEKRRLEQAAKHGRQDPTLSRSSTGRKHGGADGSGNYGVHSTDGKRPNGERTGRPVPAISSARQRYSIAADIARVLTEKYFLPHPFEESKHPRSFDGKFGNKGGGQPAPQQPHPAQPKPQQPHPQAPRQAAAPAKSPAAPQAPARSQQKMFPDSGGDPEQDMIRGRQFARMDCGNCVHVLGRLSVTSQYQPGQNEAVLLTDEWSLKMNDSFIDAAIEINRPVKFIQPLKRVDLEAQTFNYKTNGTQIGRSVLRREVTRLAHAGYLPVRNGAGELVGMQPPRGKR